MPCMCGDVECPSCGPAQGHGDKVVMELADGVLVFRGPGPTLTLLDEDGDELLSVPRPLVNTLTPWLDCGCDSCIKRLARPVLDGLRMVHGRAFARGKEVGRASFKSDVLRLLGAEPTKEENVYD